MKTRRILYHTTQVGENFPALLSILAKTLLEEQAEERARAASTSQPADDVESEAPSPNPEDTEQAPAIPSPASDSK